MPKRYDEQTRAKAVRLVREHRDDYVSEYEAIKAIAGRLGMNPETLRKWLRQAEVDAGQVDGTTTAATRENAVSLEVEHSQLTIRTRVRNIRRCTSARRCC